jgi:hypothetical protein
MPQRKLGIHEQDIPFREYVCEGASLNVSSQSAEGLEHPGPPEPH